MAILNRIGAIGALILLSNPVIAEDRLQPDFTFKRVVVPSASNGSRITVQIDPAIEASSSSQPQIGQDVTSSAETDSQPGPLPMGWFWDQVSPDLSAKGPGRLEQAVSALRESDTPVNAPRLRTLQQIAAAYHTDILRHTVGTNVSPALVVALISIESGGRVDAESSAGASGLMQLMPATAERFGVTDRTDPSENIAGGVAYLSWLMDHFDNDPILTLAGYNAGEGSVRDNSGVPPFAETRAYVPKVLAAWTVARALCKTPPELVSDGCVFQTGG